MISRTLDKTSEESPDLPISGGGKKVGDQSLHNGRGRWTALLLIATLVVPMALAYLIFKTGIGLPEGTLNHGELLNPAKAVADLNLIDEKGLPVDLMAGDKKWKILIPGAADCDQGCRDNLYLTRQVHIRLGEKSHRVERLYVNLDRQLNPELRNLFEREHPGLKYVQVSPEQWRQWLGQTNAPANTLSAHNYFLVDQKGFAMMFYSPTHPGKDLLEDLKRLLKYSYEE